MKTKYFVGVLLGLLLFLGSCGPEPQTKTELVLAPTESDSLQALFTNLSREFDKLRPQVIMPADGYLQYPYLIPSGFYKQMWDWDGFFIGNHLASLDPENGKYLKYWALNFLNSIDEDGYISGCITTEGPRPIFGRFAVKPFLAQGVYFASEKLGDYEWVRDYYMALKKVSTNRENFQKDRETGLFYWEIAMQSGVDNNPAMNFYQDDKRKFLSCDMNTWQYREYKAMAIIAAELGVENDIRYYSALANTLKTKIENVLWFEEDMSFFNVEVGTLEPQKKVVFSNFVPLMDDLISRPRAEEMIRRYLLNPNHLLAPYGIRTLSKADPDYNNKNVIVPFSNWQGPVWPIANFIYSVGMVRYGFEKEASELAAHTGTLLLNDIYAYGSMHENYHAETGAPLAPTAEQSENGIFTGFVGWNLLTQNMLEGAIHGKWLNLEIKKVREVVR